MYKNVLYLTGKLTALTAVTAYEIWANAQSGLNAVCVLAFCCLFLTDFLLNRKPDWPAAQRGKSVQRTESACGKQLCRRKVLQLICLCVEIAGTFFCGRELCFPLLLILLFQLIDMLRADGYFYLISAVVTVLAAFIFKPSFYLTASAFMIAALGMFARYVIEKLEHYQKLSEVLREDIAVQNEKIAELKSYAKTVRDAVAMEERSRFSSRIHDRLGHGISGSIILLEGVRLNFKSNPEQAEKSLNTAIENLRGSVDSIREVLREERPKRSEANITDFREMLGRFEMNYGIKTEFSAKGDTEKVIPQIWGCLKENLTEAMTNTIKHSNADKFEVHIYIYNKIIRVEFFDNGESGGFTKGMGLETMEERTAACGGKCLYENGGPGFKIINVFRL